MHTRNTKLKLTTFLLYFIFTVVPALLISFIIAVHKMEDYEIEYKNDAHRIASLHARNIDNFIGETAGRLEMLATIIKVQHYSLNNIEEVLKETHKNDDRFAGYYWANSRGDVIISSISPYSPVNISDRAYFKEAMELRKTSISEAYTGRITGYHIITLATPVLENNKPLGVLLASLRLDQLEENGYSLLENEKIVINDRAGNKVIESGTVNQSERLVTDQLSLNHIPWTITASINYNDVHLHRITFFYYFLITYICANIILLLIYNSRLKWNGKLAKKQYEFQKMELVGNLAASTAHEIRNPLTGISGLVKLLSEEYHDKKAQSYFDVIQIEIARINSIVSELLFLGRPTAHSLKTYNINEVIKEIEPILQSEANYTNVQLSVSYSAKEQHVLCVKDHLKQVILNLSKNSLQAMPNGGELKISIDGDMTNCFIIVKDTGKGIPKDELDKIFHPFFTKKKDGSGIGLTVCKRIIDSYNGSISIQSTPDIGTEVEIIIPLMKRDMS